MSFVIIFLYIAYKIYASCMGFEQDNYDRKMVSPSILGSLHFVCPMWQKPEY